MAERQVFDRKKKFQPFEKTIPICIRAAHRNLQQNVFQKHDPWPAAREPPTSLWLILVKP